MVKSFDPFAARELPELKLGEHGSWPLLDLTDPMIEKLQALQVEIEQLDTEKQTVAALARIVGKLAAGATSEPALEELIVDLADEAKHGKKALGVAALRGCVDFIREHIESLTAAGEA